MLLYFPTTFLQEQVAEQKVPNQEEEEASKLEDDNDMTMDQGMKMFS